MKQKQPPKGATEENKVLDLGANVSRVLVVVGGGGVTTLGGGGGCEDGATTISMAWPPPPGSYETVGNSRGGVVSTLGSKSGLGW